MVMVGLGTSLRSAGPSGPKSIYMVMVGLGTGTTSLIARCIGVENKKRANIHSILLTLIISIVIPIILLVFLKDILYAMGAASVLTLATEYGQIVYRILCITI